MKSSQNKDTLFANHSFDDEDGSAHPELEAFRLRWREEIKSRRYQSVMTRFPPELRLKVLEAVFDIADGVQPYAFEPWIVNILMASKEFYCEGLSFLLCHRMKVVIARKLFMSPGKNHHLVTLSPIIQPDASQPIDLARVPLPEDPICTYIPTTQRGGSVEAVESFKRLGDVRFTPEGLLRRLPPTLGLKVVTRPASITSPYIGMKIQRLSVTFDIDEPSPADLDMFSHLVQLGRALENLTGKHLKTLLFVSVDFGQHYRRQEPPIKPVIKAEERFVVKTNELEVDVSDAWFLLLRAMAKVGRGIPQNGAIMQKQQLDGQT